MRALGVLALAAGLLAMLRSAVPMDPGVDYFADASPAIDALVRGDLQAFFTQHALMGPFSLLVRAPFVALVFDRSIETVYFAGVLPCLAGVAALVAALRRRMAALGRPAAAIGLVTLVALLNTGTFRAIHWGHPEELLAGALCAGAVLAALRDRTLAAALLLGLAVATKQWAVIATVPVLLAASQRRIGIALLAGAIAAAFTLPMIVLAPDSFVSVHKDAVVAVGNVSPPNVWFPFSSPREHVASGLGSGFLYEIPGWLSALTHPLIVLLGLPLGALYLRRRRDAGAREDALGLLALLLLARCLLDPWNIDYYHAPFLLALLSWEAVARDGWPRLTVLAGALLAATFPASLTTMSAMSAEPLRYCLPYLAWALPLAAWLATGVFAPARAAAIAASVRGRLAARRARAANVARA
jgi:Glycosyltransferase family 87